MRQQSRQGSRARCQTAAAAGHRPLLQRSVLTCSIVLITAHTFFTSIPAPQAVTWQHKQQDVTAADSRAALMRIASSRTCQGCLSCCCKWSGVRLLGQAATYNALASASVCSFKPQTFAHDCSTHEQWFKVWFCLYKGVQKVSKKVSRIESRTACFVSPST